MLKKRPIYLDYMATTPVDSRVIEAMLPYLGPEGEFGNPASSTHVYGQQAACAIEHARAQIADSVGAFAEDIVFTSGATEADNLAILGAARFYKRNGLHVITMMTEHKAVLDSFHQLEQEGFDVTYLPPGSDGILDLKALIEAVRNDTILVSIMHVNNEIGVIQDIQAIGEFLRSKGVLFHVDAAQSAGKLAIDLQQLPVDLMSFSAHKNYGPKGIGALYVRRKPRVRLQPITYGGGHEGGLRSGTLPTHQIVGMGKAFELSSISFKEEQARLFALRERLWQAICDLPNIQLNGHRIKRIAGNLNICFQGLEGHMLQMALSDLAISTTSACSSAQHQPSYVLQALGLTSAMASSSIRLSIGRFTTAEEVERAISIIRDQIIPLYR